MVVEAQRLLQIRGPLGVRGAQLLEDLAVAAHQRDERARRRRARPQPVGVGEEVALERRARQPQLGGEGRVHRLRQQLGLAGDARRSSRISATSTRFFPSGMVTETSSSAAPLTSASRICLRRRGRRDLVAPGLEAPGDAALAGVEAEDGGLADEAGGREAIGDVVRRRALRDLDLDATLRRPGGRVAVAPGRARDEPTAASPTTVVTTNTMSARFMRALHALAVSRVQPPLQNNRGGHPIDHLPAARARQIGREQDLLGLDGAEALVDQLDRDRQHRAQPLGESLRALRGAAHLPLGRQRQAQHHALGVELVHDGGDGVEIALAAVARQRRVRLRGQASASVTATPMRRAPRSMAMTLRDTTVVYTSAMSDHPKPPAAEATAPQLQIDIDEVTAQGAYSNLVLINHNENEFVLDFAYLQPGRRAPACAAASSPRRATPSASCARSRSTCAATKSASARSTSRKRPRPAA